VGRRCNCIRNLAEGEGFEPPKACTLVVFKTTAIDHSAIPPATTNDTVELGGPATSHGSAATRLTEPNDSW
jgi:hypothetical protein